MSVLFVVNCQIIDIDLSIDRKANNLPHIKAIVKSFAEGVIVQVHTMIRG